MLQFGTRCAHFSTSLTSNKQTLPFLLRFYSFNFTTGTDEDASVTDHEDAQQDAFEDANEHLEEESQRGRSKNKKRPSSHHSKEPRIRKKKRRSVPVQSDEDSSPQRRPLSESFHHNRYRQRLDNHQTMAGTKGRSNLKRKSRTSSGNDDDESLSSRDQDLQRLLEEKDAELLRLKKRAKYASTVASKSTTTNAKPSAMAREVSKKTKTDLWPIKKFFYNDTKLLEGTRFVMGRIGNLLLFDGLAPNDRIDSEELWIANHKNEVRIAMNYQRNYVQQELRDFVVKVHDDGEEDMLPTVEEILMLLERKGLASGAKKETMEAKFDVYWDKLIPKVAGHANWCPTKRHYSLLSTATTPSLKDEPDIPCVHHTSEGFLVAIWEHCYPRWSYMCLQKRAKKPIDPDHADMAGKGYTTFSSGRKPLGGWTLVGRQRVKVLSKLNKTARQKASVEAIEKAALKRIRCVLVT